MKNNHWLGRKHTSETLSKMSLAKKGKPSPRKGVTLTIEQRKQISDTNKRLGIKPPSRKGIKLTELQKEKLRGRPQLFREESPNWRGNNAGLEARHTDIRKIFPKPELCQDCRKVPPRDLANISQEYKREISDWEWLCRKCHMTKDGRINAVKKLAKQRIGRYRLKLLEKGITQGFYWNKRTKRWMVQIQRKYFGSFLEKEKAIVVAREMTKKIYEDCQLGTD